MNNQALNHSNIARLYLHTFHQSATEVTESSSEADEDEERGPRQQAEVVTEDRRDVHRRRFSHWLSSVTSQWGPPHGHEEYDKWKQNKLCMLLGMTLLIGSVCAVFLVAFLNRMDSQPTHFLSDAEVGGSGNETASPIFNATTAVENNLSILQDNGEGNSP